MSSPDSLQELLEFAISLAREGGDSTLPFFYSADLQVDSKADGSHVTAADRGAEELMRKRLGESFPEDGIVGEEWGVKPGSSGRTWFLDPVDGTEVFVRGVPLYGTLVGCARDGEPMADVGVIYMPATSQIVFASKSGGAWWSDQVERFAESPGPVADLRNARVSGITDPAQACVIANAPEWWIRTGREEVYNRVQRSFGLPRMWAHCYAPFMVATGRADVWVEPSAHDWDFAPMNLILEEAGGIATTVTGEHTFRGHSMVGSASKELHEVAMKALKGF